MSKIIGAISIDDIYKNVEGSAINLHNDILIIGPSGFDATNDISTINLGNNNTFIRSTYNDSLIIGSTQIILTTNGSESLRILENGNVGIGITNPDNRIHIVDNVPSIGVSINTIDSGPPLFESFEANQLPESFTQDLIIEKRHSIAKDTIYGYTASSIDLRANNSNGDRFSTGSIIGLVDAFGTNNNTGSIAFFTNSNETPIYHDDSRNIGNLLEPVLTLGSDKRAFFTGNVGIGTDNPLNSLHVSGNGLRISADNQNLGLMVFGTNDDSDIYFNGSDLFFRVNSLERLRIKQNGNVGIGTDNPSQLLEVRGFNATIRVHDQTNSIPQMHFTRGLSTGYGSSAFADWRIGVNSTSIPNFIIQSRYNNGANGALALSAKFDTGNVGIGVTEPSQSLDVIGDALIQGGDLFLFDTNEKIASNGTDMFFHVNNIETVRFKAGGNVGIGTNNPSKLLDVYGSNSSMVIRSTSFSHKSTLFMSTPNLITAPAKTCIQAVGISDFNKSELHFCLNNISDNTTEVSTSDSKMVILPSGNIGIGTNAPSQTLHVQGDALIQGGDLFLVDTNEKIASNGTDLFFHVNNIETVRFKAGGNVGIGVTNPSQTLDVIGDALIRGGDLFLFDTNEKIASNGTDILFNVNNIETVRFKAGGNVGIGVTNPSQTLDVIGDALIRGGDLFLFDTNEKIASDGTDLFFNVNNIETVRFKAGGNVGIGVTNPSQKLHVQGDANINGNIRTGVTTITSNTTLNHTHSVVLCDTTGGNITVSLPVSHDATAEPNFKGSVFHIIKIDNSVNKVIISRSGSDVIDGSIVPVELLEQDSRITVLNAGGVSSIGRWYSI